MFNDNGMSAPTANVIEQPRSTVKRNQTQMKEGNESPSPDYKRNTNEVSRTLNFDAVPNGTDVIDVDMITAMSTPQKTNVNNQVKPKGSTTPKKTNRQANETPNKMQQVANPYKPSTSKPIQNHPRE